MKNEFTSYCSRYYWLKCQLEELETRFGTKLANALPYTGQTRIAELDAIIHCNRNIQKTQTYIKECRKEMEETGRTILKIFEYFEIPPFTWLTCELKGEYEIAVWINDAQAVHCIKTRELYQPAPNSSIMTIRFSGPKPRWPDDEDEEEEDIF